MIYLRNIAFYAAFYTGSVGYVLAALFAMHFRRKWLRAICDGWSKHHFRCCRIFLGIELRETGTRPDGPALYAIKHEAFYEAIGMPHLFDHPAGYAKQELFDIPGWGRAARAYGAIPVQREAGAKALRAMVREVAPALAQQRPIIIFPEGKRVPHGERPPLQSGFAALYKLIGLPVVPVAVDSGLIYQQTWKPSGIITLHFGEAIAPGLPRPEIEARVHAGINVLNGEPAADDAA